MKRSASSTPLLNRLKRHLRKPLSRRGEQSELAAFTGAHRQQIHRWFIKGEGRPTAKVTMAALRWLNTLPRRKKNYGFSPTWPEFKSSMPHFLKPRGFKTQCATACRVDASQISRYFAESPNGRLPDGEVALRALQWVLEVEKLYFQISASRPDLRISHWDHVEKGLKMMQRFSDQLPQHRVKGSAP